MKAIVFGIFILVLALENAHGNPKWKLSCECGSKKEGISLSNHPWVAVILKKSDHDHLCGGVVITKKHILTTARYTLGKEASHLIVCLGVDDINDCRDSTRMYIFDVKKIKVHSEFNLYTKVNDIAIVKTKDEIVLTGIIVPICFPSDLFYGDLDKLTLKTSGWGDKHKSTKLRDRDLSIVPHKNCVVKIPTAKLQREICTKTAKGGMCKRERGGAVWWMDSDVDRYTLSGLISHGPMSCDDNESDEPFVDTFVHSYRQWIISKVGKGKLCMKVEITND